MIEYGERNRGLSSSQKVSWTMEKVILIDLILLILPSSQMAPPKEFFRDVIRRERNNVNSVVFEVRQDDLASLDLFQDSKFLTDLLQENLDYVSVTVTDSLTSWAPPSTVPGNLTLSQYAAFPSLHFYLHPADFLTSRVRPFDKYFVRFNASEDDSRIFDGLRLDSFVFSFLADEKSGETKLSEHYGIKGLPRHNFDIGKWTAKGGVRIFQPQIWMRRSNMTGVHLNTIVEDSTMTTNVFVSEDDDHEVVNVTGAYQEVFQQIQEILGFSYDIMRPEDKTWGSLEANGSWSGKPVRSMRSS